MSQPSATLGSPLLCCEATQVVLALIQRLKRIKRSKKREAGIWKEGFPPD